MTTFEEKTTQVMRKYQIKDPEVKGFFEDLAELLELSIKTSKPHLSDIEKCVVENMRASNGRGSIQFEIKYHDYKITEGTYTVFKRIKY